MQRADEFKSLLPMPGAFHTAECTEQDIGKFIQGSGLDDALKQTKVFGVKSIGSVISGTRYFRSLKGLLILAGAIEKIKWQGFYQNI